MSTKTKYKRVLLKLSGEALMGDGDFGLDMPTLDRIAGEIKQIHELGVELAIVVGGGNIFRGMKGAASGMERTKADYMGMLATIMNGLALEGALKNKNIPAQAVSAIPMPLVCKAYNRDECDQALKNGNVIIFTAGTGNPYFTTDTAATLRAVEMKADIMAKATQVDGVYTADPKKDPKAKRYDKLTFDKALQDDLKIMDATAFALAKENNLPLLVFSIWEKGNLKKAMLGTATSTLITG